jgi:hypothetical protein
LQILSFFGIFDTIALEQPPDEFGMILDDVERAGLSSIGLRRAL